MLNRFGPVFCIVWRSQWELQLSMSKTVVWRVLCKRLVFKPYCIQMVQQLMGEDHKCRPDFCLQLQDLMSSDDFLEKVQFSDEATFHISGAVNCCNVRIWGSENPHAYVEHQCDPPKVNVFCAISSQKVYSPFFFLMKKPLLAWHIWTCCNCG